MVADDVHDLEISSAVSANDVDPTQSKLNSASFAIGMAGALIGMAMLSLVGLAIAGFGVMLRGWSGLNRLLIVVLAAVSMMPVVWTMWSLGSAGLPGAAFQGVDPIVTDDGVQLVVNGIWATTAALLLPMIVGAAVRIGILSRREGVSSAAFVVAALLVVGWGACGDSTNMSVAQAQGYSVALANAEKSVDKRMSELSDADTSVSRDLAMYLKASIWIDGRNLVPDDGGKFEVLRKQVLSR